MVPVAAATPAIMGETAAGSSTFCTTTDMLTALPPTATQVAPINPPNNACDELDGIPRYQVSRFHMIAPSRAPNTMYGPAPAWNLLSSTMPPEIVLATLTDRNAPTRLSSADTVTAVLGLNA